MSKLLPARSHWSLAVRRASAALPRWPSPPPGSRWWSPTWTAPAARARSRRSARREAKPSSFAATSPATPKVKALVEGCAAAYGRLDYAFNNAGIEIEQGKLADGNEAEFDAIMAVNVKGVWLCMKHQIPLMLAQGGGAIVNTASVAGLGAAPKMSIYAASKHAVIGLTKSAAIEYAKKGIRVNAVCPAVIDTDMFRRAYEADPRKAEFAAAMHPLGRVGRVEEIAAAVLYLCCDNAGFTTGIALPVDGGATAI